jgi:hypothetical protein
MQVAGDQFPSTVGTKFEADGSARYFPGNTLLCHLRPDNPDLAAVTAIQQTIRDASFAHHFTFLPPSSFHMTVFEGVCDLVRREGHWPAAFAGADLPAVTAEYKQKLQALPAGTPFRLRATGFHISDGVRMPSIELAGLDADNERRLRAFRDAASAVLGIRHADHETYVFHITLAYWIRFAGSEDERVIDAAHHALEPHLRNALNEVTFTPVEFCTFDDMTHFEPILALQA